RDHVTVNTEVLCSLLDSAHPLRRDIQLTSKLLLSHARGPPYFGDAASNRTDDFLGVQLWHPATLTQAPDRKNNLWVDFKKKHRHSIQLEAQMTIHHLLRRAAGLALVTLCACSALQQTLHGETPRPKVAESREGCDANADRVWNIG